MYVRVASSLGRSQRERERGVSSRVVKIYKRFIFKRWWKERDIHVWGDK